MMGVHGYSLFCMNYNQCFPSFRFVGEYDFRVSDIACYFVHRLAALSE